MRHRSGEIVRDQAGKHDGTPESAKSSSSGHFEQQANPPGTRYCVRTTRSTSTACRPRNTHKFAAVRGRRNAWRATETPPASAHSSTRETYMRFVRHTSKNAMKDCKPWSNHLFPVFLSRFNTPHKNFERRRIRTTVIVYPTEPVHHSLAPNHSRLKTLKIRPLSNECPRCIKQQQCAPSRCTAPSWPKQAPPPPSPAAETMAVSLRLLLPLGPVLRPE